MRFSVTLDRDEDGVWIVECPSIPGCVSLVVQKTFWSLKQVSI